MLEALMIEVQMFQDFDGGKILMGATKEHVFRIICC
jgi:hypothetical protein